MDSRCTEEKRPQQRSVQGLHYHFPPNHDNLKAFVPHSDTVALLSQCWCKITFATTRKQSAMHPHQQLTTAAEQPSLPSLALLPVLHVQPRNFLHHKFCRRNVGPIMKNPSAKCLIYG